MVRFGVVLSVVLVAIGLLVTGVVAGSLLLVAISIGVALLAFLMLVGVVISFRHEIFGSAAKDEQTAATAAVPAERRAVGPAAAGRQDRADDTKKAAAAGPKPKARTPAAARAPTGTTAGARVPAVPATAAPTTAAPMTAAPMTAARAAAAGAAAKGPDRPSPPNAGDRAEPRRASRLERESARAAVIRTTPSGEPRQPAPMAGQAAGPANGDAAPSKGDAGPAKGDAGLSSGESKQPAAQAPAATVTRAGDPAAAAAGVAAKEGKTEQKPASAGEAGRRDATGSAPHRPATPKQAAQDAGPGDAVQPSDVKTGEPAGGTAADRPAGEEPDPADAAQVSVVPGITRYHRSDCLLIRFLSADDLEVMTRRQAADGGCVPCKACKPDQEAANLAVG